MNSEQKETDAVSTSTHLEERVQVLNHADTFAIYNMFGDFPSSSSSAYGLFYRGCRYLDAFDLRINQRKPLLLNSMIKDRNEKLIVNLSNDEIRHKDGTVTPKGVILITRSKFLFDGVSYEKVCFRNFDQIAHPLPVSFRYAVDFKDIFEVRGVERKRQGTMLGFQQADAHSLRFAYQGLDQIQREVCLTFSLPFSAANERECQFQLMLQPGEEQVLAIQVEPKDSPSVDAPFGFDEAEAKLVSQLKRNRHLIANILTDNEQFNHWIDRSTVDFASLLYATEDGLYPLAGVPWYNTIFGRDGLISAFFTLWTAPEIAQGVLKYLARHMAHEVDAFKDAEPGKVVHEMRTGEMANLREIPFKQYYGTIDATPLFVWLAGEYFQRTHDGETLREIWPQVEQALQWIDTYGDPDGDGYVEYQRKDETGLHNQGWKDSHDAISHADGSLADPPIALCEVQGYVYAARRKASLMAEHLGKSELARTLRDKAFQLKVKFNRDFWDEKLGTYCLALDGEKRPCRVLSSNPGHCLFTGIVDAEKAPLLAKSLLNPAIFSGWGIRTLSEDSRRFNPLSYHNGSVWPHDNAIAAIGLSRYGLKREALTILDALFDAANRFDGARLPELFCGLNRQAGEAPTRYPVACSPQAWSVAAVFGLLQAIIGIEINALDKTLTLDQPVLPDYLQSLTIHGLRLDHRDLRINMQSYEKDVGVNMSSKPEGWRVIINK